MKHANQPSKRLSDLRFRALRAVGGFIYPGYRFKWPQMDWLEQASFNAYLDSFGEANGPNSERRWMIRELMRLVAAVPGDTAECGAFQGAGSYLICLMNSRTNLKRWHHVFDSFEGLSPPQATDGTYWSKGDLAAGEGLVRSRLAPFTDFSLHKGWIPERFPDVADRQFAFVHIDVDLYQPTLDSMSFFYQRLSPGGILVCDDYAFSTCPGATIAVDEVLAGKPEKMLVLPSGGGFMIKGIPTSNGGLSDP